jgi:hypothetical protein
MIGLAAAVILALGVGVLVYNRQPQASPPAPVAASPGNPPSPASAPPESAPAAPAQPSGAAGKQPLGGAPAAGSASAAPAPQRSAAPAVTGGASAAKGPSGVRPPDRPSTGTQRGAAAAPAAPPLTAQAMLRRGFVASRTASENVRGISKTLSGFDSRKSKGVTVKRAPEVDGRIEFTTTPHRVKPGDKYSLRVSLVNDGKRPIEIREVAVTTALNRKESSTTVKPLVKQVSPRQNEVIHEISGTWDKNTTSFTVEVRVMSDRQDLYRNELVWK